MKRVQTTISWTIVLLSLLLVAIPGSGRAQIDDENRPLVASGTSPMPPGDIADARELALEEALRAAVEQALGRLLPAQRIVRFYPLLIEQVLERPMSYVQDYQSIHEVKGPQVYRVTVQTTLYVQGLRRELRQLGLFLADSERPMVVVLVAERPEPEMPWEWWWSIPSAEAQTLSFTRALIRSLSIRGLVPLDPSLLLGKLPLDPVYQEPLLEDTQGTALGKALEAELVVVGEVSLQIASDGTPAIAIASVRALHTGSGQLLTRASATVQIQPTADQSLPDHGFTALAERVAPQLAEAMLAPFTQEVQAPKEVTVRVLGMRTYGDLILIKEYIQGAPGVARVNQMQLEAGQGSFTLVLSGTLDELSRALQGHDFGAFITSTESTDADFIDVRIIDKR